MTGPGWPRTCSHPIYARTLTGVRMFSPCYFHVLISIGILESNSLSLSTIKLRHTCTALGLAGLKY